MRLFTAVLLAIGLSAPTHGQVSGAGNKTRSDQNPAAGPTLADTIGFLHDIYLRQPRLTTSPDPQSTRVDEKFSFDEVGDCQVKAEFLRTTQHSAPGPDGSLVHKEKIVTILSLTASDPLSIKVVSNEGYLVVISKAVMLRGRVALDVDPSRPVLNLPQSSSASVAGFVLSATPAEIILVASDGNRYRISLPQAKASVTRNGQQPDALPNVQAGDYITYRRDGRKANYDYSSPRLSSQLAHGNVKLPETYAEDSLPPLADEETANRVAKALIHAMSLCHKDEKPSPF